jgi:AcrR family transcriptional regulator
MTPIDESKSQPRWSRRPEDRPDEILAAAAEVFGEMGFVRASLSDVARRAGVSAGTVHHYFGSKEALFEELVRQKMEVFDGIEALIVEHRGSHGQVLRAVLEHIARVSADRRAACLGSVVRAEAASLPGPAKIMMDQVGGRLGHLLGCLIEAGVKAGEFRAFDPESVSRVIVPSLMGVIQDYHTLGTVIKRPPVALERQIAAWFDVVFEGLLVHRPTT